MKSAFRTWGLAFLAAALMTGCGSDNSTGGGSGSSSNSDLLKGTSSSNTKSWSEFKNEVSNGRFQGNSTGEFYWQNVNYLSSGTSSNCKTKWSGFLTYCSYSGNTGSSSYLPGISTRIVENDGSVYRINFNEDTDFGNSLSSIRNTLVSKMNSATDIRKCVTPQGYHSGYFLGYQEICFYIDGRTVDGVNHSNYATLLRNEASKRYIFTQGGKTYLVDTGRPLGANPIGVSDANGANMKVLYGSN